MTSCGERDDDLFSGDQLHFGFDHSLRTTEIQSCLLKLLFTLTLAHVKSTYVNKPAALNELDTPVIDVGDIQINYRAIMSA